MRYFVEASYDGTDFVGWQIQPNGRSVQEVVQDALTTILRVPIEVVGCGRTDAGVHAAKYVFHFDLVEELPERFTDKLNRYLPDDIAFKRTYKVDETMHARFSALEREYRYYIHFHKDPLIRHKSLYLPQGVSYDWDLIREVSALLTKYEAFRPFCKTGSDTPHYLCAGLQTTWRIDEEGALFIISANRFLRGMVRLIIGSLLRVGKHEISLAEIQTSLDNQTPLQKADSAPAHALHLTNIHY